MKSSNTAQSRYSLALAVGVIPDDILLEDSAHVFTPEMDKVRWLVGYNTGMTKTKADKIVRVVNLWLGTNRFANRQSEFTSNHETAKE